jgi:DNA repair protein RadC
MVPFALLAELGRAPVDGLPLLETPGPGQPYNPFTIRDQPGPNPKKFRLDTPPLDNGVAIANELRGLFQNSHVEDGVEHFFVLMLNTRRQLIGLSHVAKGTLDSALVHPREVFRPAIRANASAVVIAHNHPSGDPSPSDNDIKITRDLVRAGKLMKIEVLDHVIMGLPTQSGGPDFISLRARGYFYE